MSERGQGIHTSILDERKRGDKELQVTETFNCPRCKKDFVITSTLGGISDEYLNELKQRQARGMNPPYDTGSDLHMEHTRGLCSDCLNEAWDWLRQNESNLSDKDRYWLNELRALRGEEEQK